jgi:hypothetical protein
MGKRKNHSAIPLNPWPNPSIIIPKSSVKIPFIILYIPPIISAIAVITDEANSIAFTIVYDNIFPISSNT